MATAQPAQRHTRLAERLAHILARLYAGERLLRSELAQEFHISERTVFRDLARLAGLVEQDAQGRYHISLALQQQLRQAGLQRFARLLGADSLALGQGQKGFDALYDALQEGTVLIKDMHHESIVPRDALFGRIEAAIREQRWCSFVYKNRRRLVAPYRLVNWQGFWYLAGLENQTLKAFTVHQVHDLVESSSTFAPDAQVAARIEAEDGIWFSPHKQTVLVDVDAQASHYFLRRPILPHQHFVQQRPDGSLRLQATVGPLEQMLPILRSWLPFMHVVEPIGLREQLKRELREYLLRDDDQDPDASEDSSSN
jgi:predicted DNA-binding transcriptional regulator YafY